MKRESFGSRLGFLLVSAGCAIGIGNVWRFPYITGQYGGGIFVFFYLLFLLLLGCKLHLLLHSGLLCLLLLSGAAAREMKAFQPELHREKRRKPVNFL